MEIWKSIPGYDGYEVSDLGRVRSFKWKRVHILRPARQQSGHFGVSLVNDGVTVFRKVHQLVMLAFVGPYPEGMEVCHNDGNPANNRLDNLRYDTHINNIQDMCKHNGGVHPLSKFRPRPVKIKPNGKENRLTVSQQKEIREIHARGDMDMLDLAYKYDVSLSAICRGVNGERWLKAGGPIKGIDY